MYMYSTCTVQCVHTCTCTVGMAYKYTHVAVMHKDNRLSTKNYCTVHNYTCTCIRYMYISYEVHVHVYNYTNLYHDEFAIHVQVATKGIHKPLFNVTFS